MPEKQPKHPNNNAKARENWESEGGAPASDHRSTKRKRGRDPNQITKAQPLTDPRMPAAQLSQREARQNLRSDRARISEPDEPLAGCRTPTRQTGGGGGGAPQGAVGALKRLRLAGCRSARPRRLLWVTSQKALGTSA